MTIDTTIDTTIDRGDSGGTVVVMSAWAALGGASGAAQRRARER